MAELRIITVDTNRPLGSKVAMLRERLAEAFALADELAGALAEANTDGVNMLQEYTGTTTLENAAAVKDMIGSVRNQLNDNGNAFIQFANRVQRAGF